MSDQQWEDRRKFKRYFSELPVRFRKSGDESAPFQEGSVANVSRGGAYVSTKAPPPIGTELKVVVSILTPLGEQQEIECLARVVWVSARSGEEGIGLTFTKIDRHSQYAILASAYCGQA